MDIYLILGYKLQPHREVLLRNAIPTGLEIWDDAIPYFDNLYQDRNKPRKNIHRLNHALARQHRYVIKDKLEYYDFFSSWVSFFLVCGLID